METSSPDDHLVASEHCLSHQPRDADSLRRCIVQASVLPEVHDQLATFVARRLLGEVLDAGHHFTGADSRRVALEKHAAPHIEVGALVDEIFCDVGGVAILVQQNFGECPDLLIELLGCAQPVDQVVAFGDRAAEQVAEQVPFLGLASTGELAQPSGAAPAGGDAPVPRSVVSVGRVLVGRVFDGRS